jgi:two-component system, NtrC family, response regulator AtoC
VVDGGSPSQDDLPTKGTRDSDDESVVLSLRVVCGERVRTHALPERGELVIGRGTAADLALDDSSISRRHAVIRVGPPVTIEDAGSANGTRVGDVPVRRGERVELHAGMVIQLGAVRAFVQRGGSRPRAREVAAAPSAPAAPVAVAVAGSELERLRDLIDKVAMGIIPVLLVGETGAGKEVIANAIHAASPRANKAYVRLNCAAFSEQLLESELFGHEKGAFTSAHQTKIGLLEAGAGGTVFFDEVGELPLPMQAKLLRVVEERAVTRVGGLTPRPIDVRFISATNRDLEADVASGRFRRDLFFRLNGVLIAIRPLRERKGEIAPLARHFIAEASRAANRARVLELSAEALSRLHAHDWPGNVRELRHVIDRAVLLCTGDVILDEHLPHERSGAPPSTVSAEPTPGTPAFPLKDQVANAEREWVLEAMSRCGGNQTRAAKLLGISRGTLAARLEAFGVPRPKKRS